MRRLSTPYPLARLVSAKASIAPLSYCYFWSTTSTLMGIMTPLVAWSRAALESIRMAIIQALGTCPFVARTASSQ